MDLTPSEMRTTRLMLDGCNTLEIAERCGLGVQTVKNRKTAIFEKLGVRDQVDLLVNYRKTARGIAERK
jgi:DNA-binding CsgD family transcriptional regulator